MRHSPLASLCPLQLGRFPVQLPFSGRCKTCLICWARNIQKPEPMALTVSYCKRCETTFQSDLEHCPSCGRRSPHGSCNFLLQWVAVLIFLLPLAVIVH